MNHSRQLETVTAEIQTAFGVVPNFFRASQESPEVAHHLFGFAKFAYIDAPIPSLFKERLFAYLSRFSESSYGLARHCAFLMGTGYAAGDPSCSPLTEDAVLDLLNELPPISTEMVHHFSQLRDLGRSGGEWPSTGSDAEKHVFAIAVGMFLKVGNQDSAANELRTYLGQALFDSLMLLLSYISFTHSWTEKHPDLKLDPDVTDFLSEHPSLNGWVLGYREKVADEMTDYNRAERLRLRNLQDLVKAKLDSIPSNPETTTSTAKLREMLSDRELQTFELIGRGHSTRKIAEIMNLSSKTIETYRARLKAKLGIKTMPELATEATAWVLRNPDAGSYPNS